MAILIDHDTKVIFQGLTGATATRMAERAIASGTSVVGGVLGGPQVAEPVPGLMAMAGQQAPAIESRSRSPGCRQASSP